jgi:hypothetical protein
MRLACLLLLLCSASTAMVGLASSTERAASAHASLRSEEPQTESDTVDLAAATAKAKPAKEKKEKPSAEDIQKAMQTTLMWAGIFMFCFGGPVCFLIPQCMHQPMKTLK